MALMPITDAMFLLAESRDTPTHVGGLQVFELPDGEGTPWVRAQYERMMEHAEVSPLFSKRPMRSLTSGGQWSWVTDDELDLEYHVRHSALPSPGRVRELLALGSRLHGSLLDRQRPLWELHVIEGLDGNRVAMYTKIHHAMVDGVSALRLLERTLTTDPTATVAPPWVSRPRPARAVANEDPSVGFSPFGLPIAAPLGAVASVARTAGEVAGVTPALLRSAQRSLNDELAAFPFKAPPSMLNVHITGARRFAADTFSLPRVKAVAQAAGVTLNDVVLAMCSGALRHYLLELDALPDQPLVAMVPVSLRTDDSAGGNAVGAVLGSLETTVADPRERLERVHQSIDIAKAGMRDLSPLQATIVSAATMAPASLISMLGGGEIWRPPFNIIISNVPGPREPLYLNGARLQGVYPMSVPYHGQALNITITSYVDNLEFGLTGCRRRVPHLQRLLAHLGDALAELEAATGTTPKKTARRPPAGASRT